MTKKSTIQEIIIQIQGMTWMSWEPKVEQALVGLDGVKKAKASHPERRATVVYDETAVTLDQMKMALQGAGYIASYREIELPESPKPDLKKESEFQPDELVCFCFQHTRNDIEQDFIKNDESTIMAQIASEKKAGGCDCSNKNPKGRWCLADVRQVVAKLKDKPVLNVIGWKYGRYNSESRWKDI